MPSRKKEAGIATGSHMMDGSRKFDAEWSGYGKKLFQKFKIQDLINFGRRLTLSRACFLVSKACSKRLRMPSSV